MTEIQEKVCKNKIRISSKYRVLSGDMFEKPEKDKPTMSEVKEN